MKYLLILPLIAACSTAPTIQTVVQRVEVPISVPCATPMPIEPLYCFNTLQSTDDIFVKVRCLLSDRKLSLGYESELSISLRSCK